MGQNCMQMNMNMQGGRMNNMYMNNMNNTMGNMNNINSMNAMNAMNVMNTMTMNNRTNNLNMNAFKPQPINNYPQPK